MKTAVYLDDDYAALLLLLMKAKVLDIRNGSFKVMLDANGMPGKLLKEEYYQLSPPVLAVDLQVVV